MFRCGEGGYRKEKQEITGIYFPILLYQPALRSRVIFLSAPARKKTIALRLRPITRCCRAGEAIFKEAQEQEPRTKASFVKEALAPAGSLRKAENKSLPGSSCIKHKFSSMM